MDLFRSRSANLERRHQAGENERCLSCAGCADYRDKAPIREAPEKALNRDIAAEENIRFLRPEWPQPGIRTDCPKSVCESM